MTLLENSKKHYLQVAQFSINAEIDKIELSLQRKA